MKSLKRQIGIMVLTGILGPSLAFGQYTADIFRDEVAQCNYFSAAPATFATYCIGDECHSTASGQTTLNGKVDVSTRSLLPIGSHSKFITAILTLMMVDKGYLKLDDSLASFFPEYSHWKDVKVRDLLQHTSGVPEYIFSGEGSARIVLSFFNRRTRIWKPSEVIATVADKPLLYEAGQRLEYNNTNYILLGMILEKATQRPLEVLVDRELAKPLGLEDTYLSIMNSEKYRLVAGYYPLDLPVPDWTINLLSNKIKKYDNYLDMTYDFDSSLLWSAGGMVSTTTDLAKIVRALFTGRLVSEELLAQMQDFKDGTVLGLPIRYGLGLMSLPSDYGDMLGHAGMTPGYFSLSNYVAERDSTLTLAQNIAPAQIFSIYYDLLDVMNSSFNGKQFIPDQLVSIDQLPLESMHFRVRGKLQPLPAEAQLFPRAFGYTLIKKKAKTEETFRQFSTQLQERKGRTVLVARGAPGLNPYVMAGSGVSKTPFVELVIDRDKLVANGSSLFPEGAGDDIIFAYRGTVSTDAKGRQSFCVSEVLDRDRPSAFQIDGQRAESFEAGQTLKFAGNLPMKKLSRHNIPEQVPDNYRTVCAK